MYGKKNTLQTAQLFAEEITDENLKNRFGTSVNEYMGREHSKAIREKINRLRNEFTQIGKSKTDTITFDELTNFFNGKNVNKYLNFLIILLAKYIPNRPRSYGKNFFNNRKRSLSTFDNRRICRKLCLF